MYFYYYNLEIRPHNPKTPNTQIALDGKGTLELQFLNHDKTQIISYHTLYLSPEAVVASMSEQQIFFQHRVDLEEKSELFKEGICHSYDILTHSPDKEQAKSFVLEIQSRQIHNETKTLNVSAEQISGEKALNRVKYYGREAKDIKDLTNQINSKGYFLLLSEYED